MSRHLGSWELSRRRVGVRRIPDPGPRQRSLRGAHRPARPSHHERSGSSAQRRRRRRVGGASYLSIAEDGTLAWTPGGEQDRTREVGWFDRQGRFTATAIAPGPYSVLALSPDGSHSVVLAGPSGGSLAGPSCGSPDLWLADLRTGGMNRLTNGGRAGPPTWFPDGVRIACSRSSPEGGEDVVVRRLDGAGGERDALLPCTQPADGDRRHPRRRPRRFQRLRCDQGPDSPRPRRRLGPGRAGGGRGRFRGGGQALP